jgi:DNA adenine methylase
VFYITDLVADAKRGDFIYFDSPYGAVKTASFTGYAETDFDRTEPGRLKQKVDKLDQRGYEAISNYP